MQKKKGISLIVLVITIIVMIILAAAIILSLNNAGIIGNANKAVSETDYKAVQTAAQLVYADILLGESTGELQQGEYIKQQLIADGTITVDQAAMYKFKNNGTVKKLQTKAEYETMYKEELAAMEGYYTVADGLFKLSTEGETALENGTLTTIAIPYGVTTIARRTAINNTTITGLIMPDTVTKLEVAAFRGCSNLKELVLSKQIEILETNALDGVGLEPNRDNGLVICEGYLLDGSESTGDVVIPNDVEVIMKSAFYANNNITSVHIPDTVYIIKDSAFGWCRNLAKIYGAENVTYIGMGAFTETAIDNEVTNGPIYIGKVLLAYVGEVTEHFEVKDGIVNISRMIFKEQKTLKSIVLPASVRFIEDHAFWNCSNLIDITFKGNISDIQIEAGAFLGSGITGELKTKIEEVQPEAFYDPLLD